MVLEYKRLLEIALKFKEVLGECEEELWGCVKELNLTPCEQQVFQLQRYESIPYSGKQEFAIWDNLAFGYCVNDNQYPIIFNDEGAAKNEAEQRNKDYYTEVHKCGESPSEGIE